MALTLENKKTIFSTYSLQGRESETGSPESQVALFSKRINYLTDHLKTYPKDNAARLGLMKLVGKRKSQLKYLQIQQIERYREIIAKLNLRK